MNDATRSVPPPRIEIERLLAIAERDLEQSPRGWHQASNALAQLHVLVPRKGASREVSRRQGLTPIPCDPDSMLGGESQGVSVIVIWRQRVSRSPATHKDTSYLSSVTVCPQVRCVFSSVLRSPACW